MISATAEVAKKYKKCCMNKETSPIPAEVIEHFQKVRAEQEYLKQAGIHINYVKPIMFKGKRYLHLAIKFMQIVLQIRPSTHSSSKSLKKRLALIGFVSKQNFLSKTAILFLSVLKNLVNGLEKMRKLQSV